MMMGERNSRYPFTASQWQELAHQALIFKYMASGQPIPSDLILPIRRSFLLDSTPTSPMPSFPHQINAGWGCYQMGFGRKAEDPEPGRCRRTDGKKWRCSKEAYPDSKYCERHMHRGKNRSRKHVEMSLTANPSNPNPNPNTTNNTSPYVSPLYSLPMAASETQHLIYPFSSSSRPPHGFGFSPQNNTTHCHLNTGSSSADKDYRYLHGLKENVDAYTLFPDISGVERDGSWRFTQLGMSSLSDPKQRSCSSLQQNSSYSHFTTDLQKQEEKQQQHCFVLGADFKSQRPVKVEREEESDKPLRHFFDDDWPLKSKESWVDLEEDRSNWASFSKTQLSISIPMAHHEFPIASSQSHHNN